MSITEITKKIESLSEEDYNMVVMLVNRLTDKPSNPLRAARNKYLQTNPMTVDEMY